MITFIAVMVSMNFILLCLNEYGSYTRDKAVGRMIVTLSADINGIEAKLNTMND